MTASVRPTTLSDIPALKRVLDDTGLFPSEMLDDMIAPFLSGEPCDDLWLTCNAADTPCGFCFARAEEMADGTWNMLAIAVDPAVQGNGHGAALTHHLEQTLKAHGVRILIADTSGTEEFAQTRAFYAKNGYDEEARIRDFWADGDDKVTLRKAL